MAAKHIYYSGRVQGVGFRYATKQLASGYEVSGWVKDLADGRVEMMVASRDPEELDAFLTELRENSSVACHIRETDARSVPDPGDLRGFVIVK